MEALLLGLEPVTAVAIGVGALILVPVAGAIDAATGSNLSKSTRDAAKTGLVWAFEAFDQTQQALAEASESFQDLVAEAKAERNAQNESASTSPEVTVVS